MTNLELNLVEACDLLCAIDMQEEKYRELAGSCETPDGNAYFVRKAKRLHDIGNTIFLKTFGHERSN